MLQFAYSLIPFLPDLDHRFFYTSNISVKRQFLVDAAAAGVRFDPAFRHAAFEDSEYAFRLIPRGLRIRYAERALAFHDHWMDLDGFAAREFRAGEMAVVFYRKHPGQDDQLQVRWVGELAGAVDVLLKQPDLLRHLEAFDRQTDALLCALAGSLEELLAIDPQLGLASTTALSIERLRTTLHRALGVIFDARRTRGKVREWFSSVNDPARMSAAQSLGSVLRKMEFLNLGSTGVQLPGASSDVHDIIAQLRMRISELEGAGSNRPLQPVPCSIRRVVERLIRNPGIFRRLLVADRYVQSRLQTSGRHTWLHHYRRIRSRMRRVLASTCS